MALKTFYWNPLAEQVENKKSMLLAWSRRSRNFTFGNAGDAFNLDLLRWKFPSESVINESSAGKRILLIGSVAHRILDGDVVAGIGSKHDTVPNSKEVRIRLLGVRGPITLQAFKRAGHDVKALRFMGDPGLLIEKIYPNVSSINPVASRVIFIPHYRERFKFNSNKRYDVVSIDATPRSIAKSICEAEFVYTSSLHGLIWAHALKRPALLVAPRTAESAHKYKDYFHSIGRPFEMIESLEKALRHKKSVSPIDVKRYIDQITLPTETELRAAGVFT